MSVFSEVNMELAQEMYEKQKSETLALTEEARTLGITEAQLQFFLKYFAKYFAEKNHKQVGSAKFEVL